MENDKSQEQHDGKVQDDRLEGTGVEEQIRAALSSDVEFTQPEIDTSAIEPDQIISLADDDGMISNAKLEADVVDTAMEAVEGDEESGPQEIVRPISPPAVLQDGTPSGILQSSESETDTLPILNENQRQGEFTQAQQQQFDSGQQQQQQTQDQDGNNQPSQGPLDAITLGQLRNLINVQRPKARHYSYPTDADSDSLPMEIDEFYSYVEAPQVTENREAWEEWCELLAKGEGGISSTQSAETSEKPSETFGGALGLGLGDGSQGDAPKDAPDRDRSMSEWTSLPTSSRRKRIQSLLSLLEVKDPVARQRASRALLYLLQGSFADTHGPEHQLSWILENARMVRASGGFGEIYSAFKIASWKHDWLSSLPDHIPSSEAAKEGEPAPEPLLTWQTKLEYLDEINLELALHFAQLYILVETQRGEEEWGDELMSLDPPLPTYLFGLVAALREKNAKGYPVKKLLLLLWKTILATFGGLKQASRCKELARELEGLPPKPPQKSVGRQKGVVTKATPLDLHNFQDEVAVKYPTYSSATRKPGDLPYDKIASAVAPIPPRKTMASTGDANGANGTAAFPGTPAPSPPPSPKPNKQKYQTDQSRPFVFPYSKSVQGPRMVPYSIEEASKLYRENMYVSLELWQLWRLREECIHEESGVASAADGTRMGFGTWEKEMRRIETSIHEGASSQGSRSPTFTDGASFMAGQGPGGMGGSQSNQNSFRSRGEPTLDRLEALERELDAELSRVESDHMLAVLDNSRYINTISSLRQKRADARRLQRVDILYRAVLPHLQSSVIVLLKLLLATVTQQNSTNSPYFQALADGIAIEDAPPPTLEDIDIVRHREITSKAISGILLLLLKWFKVSHIMKFNFLSQLLVDSNCLLLILKMFGLTEINNQVKVVNEIPNFNFFRFCELNCGQEPRKPKPEDTVMAKQPFEGLPSPPMGLTHLNSTIEDVEFMDRYSFRNFFAGLNFTRILQKLTKRKIHRILLLVQYKSSAILKRTLKVPHPDLQLYALKVIKNQVPFCGRKWRQANMKVITAIYLNCRPDLRDEWLSGADIDGDVEESLPQEQALRGLVKYYNQSRIGSPSNTSSGLSGQQGSQSGHGHKRSISTGINAGQLPDGLAGDAQSNAAFFNATGAGVGGNVNAGHSQTNMPASPSALNRPNLNFFESEILPPLRRGAETTAGTRRYIPDDLLDGYLDDYEDILGEVFGEGDQSILGNTGSSLGGQDEDGQWHGLSNEGSQAAWARLNEILGDNESIPDSESVHSLNSYGEGAEIGQQGMEREGLKSPDMAIRRRAMEEDELENGAQTWESLSPIAITTLSSSRPSTPGSPHHIRRRSSNDGSPGMLLDSTDLSNSGLGLRKGSDSSPLRPVMSFGPEILNDDAEQGGDPILAGVAIDDEEEEEDLIGVNPRPEPKAGGIDEVEHVWNV